MFRGSIWVWGGSRIQDVLSSVRVTFEANEVEKTAARGEVFSSSFLVRLLDLNSRRWLVLLFTCLNPLEQSGSHVTAGPAVFVVAQL